MILLIYIFSSVMIVLQQCKTERVVKLAILNFSFSLVFIIGKSDILVICLDDVNEGPIGYFSLFYVL